MTDRPDLDALDAAEAAMTRRPWHTEGSVQAVYAHVKGGRPNGEGLFETGRYYGKNTEHPIANRDGIVAIRNAWPAVSAELRAAREVVEAARNAAFLVVDRHRRSVLSKALAAYDALRGEK